MRGHGLAYAGTCSDDANASASSQSRRRLRRRSPANNAVSSQSKTDMSSATLAKTASCSASEGTGIRTRFRLFALMPKLPTVVALYLSISRRTQEPGLQAREMQGAVRSHQGANELACPDK